MARALKGLGSPGISLVFEYACWRLEAVDAAEVNVNSSYQTLRLRLLLIYCLGKRKKKNNNLFSLLFLFFFLFFLLDSPPLILILTYILSIPFIPFIPSPLSILSITTLRKARCLRQNQRVKMSTKQDWRCKNLASRHELGANKDLGITSRASSATPLSRPTAKR